MMQVELFHREIEPIGWNVASPPFLLLLLNAKATHETKYSGRFDYFVAQQSLSEVLANYSKSF
jgi:hypothetical protein